jgi:uncharacterized membrane protein
VAIIAGLAVGWVSLILLAPFLPIPAAGLLYLFGSRICHQIAERSFHLDGAQLPVCARCVGIYAGAAVGALVYVGRVPRSGPAMRYVIAAVALNLATIALEWFGAWHPGNGVRATAGALLGIAAALATIEYTRCTSRRPIAPDLPGTPT